MAAKCDNRNIYMQACSGAENAAQIFQTTDKQQNGVPARTVNFVESNRLFIAKNKCSQSILRVGLFIVPIDSASAA